MWAVGLGENRVHFKNRKELKGVDKVMGLKKNNIATGRVGSN